MSVENKNENTQPVNSKVEKLKKEINKLKEKDVSILETPAHSYAEEAIVKVFKSVHDKAITTWEKSLIAGFLAGLFIAITYVAILFALKGVETSGIRSIITGAVFPTAILLITFIGGSMFTSNSVGFLHVYHGTSTASKFVSNLFLVLAGNFIGTFFGAFIFYLMGGLDIKSVDISNNEASYQAFNLFAHKLNHLGMSGSAQPASLFGKTFLNNFASGIFCNILVAATVWLTYATKNAVAVVLLLVFDIFAFGIAGYQHIVANSFVFFIGIFMNGSQLNAHGHLLTIGWTAVGFFFIFNLLPTLIGNFVGGGIILPLSTYILFRQRAKACLITIKLEVLEKHLAKIEAKNELRLKR